VLHLLFTYLRSQAYFISDDAPVKYFDFASRFGKKFGHTFRIIPGPVATILAHFVEFLAHLTRFDVMPHIPVLDDGDKRHAVTK